MSKNYEQLDYQYRNIPIPGGGYVTGFLFHDKEPNLLYARTDIGGTYRYNFKTRTWISLIDHVKQDNLAECYPLSFALDSEDSQRLYIVCGYSNRNTGVLCISKNQGESFEYLEMPCKIHGNNPGRGTGERLLVDPNNSRVLYYGSQSRGLMRSLDLGRTWEYITVSEDGSKEKNEQEITFVWIDARAMENGLSSTIIVGTSGEGAAIGKVRGHSLYISTDCGKTFNQLEEPQSTLARTDESGYVGYVAARTAFDGEYLYITMSETGTHGWSFSSYSCDCGAQKSGKVMRYRLLADGTVTECKDITPPVNIDNSNLQEDYAPFGMGGNCSIPGL